MYCVKMKPQNIDDFLEHKWLAEKGIGYPNMSVEEEKKQMSSSLKEVINHLVDIAHGQAKSAGWWGDLNTGKPITDNPMCFARSLALIHSELSEAMEGDRKDVMDDKLPHRKMREVELADAFIRLLDTSGGFGIDLGGAVEEKLEYNKTRADHQKSNRKGAGGKSY